MPSNRTKFSSTNNVGETKYTTYVSYSVYSFGPNGSLFLRWYCNSRVDSKGNISNVGNGVQSPTTMFWELLSVCIWIMMHGSNTIRSKKDRAVL
jgi:hypothetical protein